MNLILAADREWGIGCENRLLAHIPGDLKYFKKRTVGKTVVMGRKTLESLPGGKTLPNRKNIILTRDKELSVDGGVTLNSIEDLMSWLIEKEIQTDDVYVVGGAQVYESFLPYCDTIYITKIYETFPADRYFINLDETDGFNVVWKSEMMEENGIKYQFFQYERLGNADDDIGINKRKRDGDEK